jgi:Rrf2 family protein
MVALAKEDNNLPKPTSKLAESLQIPLPFLHQIGHSLMQSGLIKATPGPKGGLKLNIPSEQISILTIAESLEGPICINDCLESHSNCIQDENCPTKNMWSMLQDQILDFLGSISLAGLVEKEVALELEPAASLLVN